MTSALKALLAFAVFMLSGWLCGIGYSDPGNPRWLGMLEFFGGIVLGITTVTYVLVKFVGRLRQL